jgi:hypothetical protein
MMDRCKLAAWAAALIGGAKYQRYNDFVGVMW